MDIGGIERMRTIDADHVTSMLHEYLKREQAYIDIGNNKTIAIGHSNGLWEAIAQIDEEPTIEPQRMRGRWIDKSEGRIEGAWPYCSVCDDMSVERFDFCPNCGADMRETE